MRSELMRRVRSRGNKSTEFRLKGMLRGYLAGWRRHVRVFGVSVDFAYLPERVAVFADGCLWHGCPLHYRASRMKTAFWRRKIARNVKRDLFAAALFRVNGWSVHRFWKCELAKPDDCACKLSDLKNVLFVKREWNLLKKGVKIP